MQGSNQNILFFDGLFLKIEEIRSKNEGVTVCDYRTRQQGSTSKLIEPRFDGFHTESKQIVLTIQNVTNRSAVVAMLLERAVEIT